MIGSRLFPLAFLALAAFAPPGASGPQTIIEDWASIEVPPPPPLVPVTVDAETTALLILDMYPTSCNAQERPSCVPTIANIQRLLGRARTAGMMVVYSAGPVANNGPVAPVDELAPAEGEVTVRAPADKFFNSGLDELLKARGITKIIVVGTSADAAVLYTVSHGVFLGYEAVIPVNGISSKNRFSELYTVVHFQNTAASVVRAVTLSSTDLISID